MSEVHMVAIITPTPGKEARVSTQTLYSKSMLRIVRKVKEMLSGLAKKVQENEPGAVSTYGVPTNDHGSNISKGQISIIRAIQW